MRVTGSKAAIAVEIGMGLFDLIVVGVVVVFVVVVMVVVVAAVVVVVESG